MDSHGVLRVVCRLVPDLLVDLLHAEDPSCVLCQEFQDAVFSRSELHFFTIHRHLLGAVVDHEAAGGKDVLCAFGSDASQVCIAPYLGLHPGDELQRIEGLGDVIVSPDVQSGDLVIILGLGRKHDDGDVFFLPDPHGGLHAVQFRHHDVHDDEMQVFLFGHVYRFQSVVCLKNIIPLVSKVDLDGLSDLTVVIHDQYVYV